MFNRETILKNLNSENYYIDKHSLDLFLNDWKIDSIYEDDGGLEFYDELALQKIKRGISLKAQGYSDEQIITLYYGQDVKEEDAEALAEAISERYPECDVEIHFGGQPIYYYYIALE